MQLSAADIGDSLYSRGFKYSCKKGVYWNAEVKWVFSKGYVERMANDDPFLMCPGPAQRLGEWKFRLVEEMPWGAKAELIEALTKEGCLFCECIHNANARIPSCCHPEVGCESLPESEDSPPPRQLRGGGRCQRGACAWTH